MATCRPLDKTTTISSGVLISQESMVRGLGCGLAAAAGSGGGWSAEVVSDWARTGQMAQLSRAKSRELRRKFDRLGLLGAIVMLRKKIG